MLVATATPKSVTINSKKFGTVRQIVVTQDFHPHGYGNKKWSVSVNGGEATYITRYATKKFGFPGNAARFSTLADTVAALTVSLTAHQAVQINQI